MEMSPQEIIDAYNNLKKNAVAKIAEKLQEAADAIAYAQTIADEYGLKYDFPEINSANEYDRSGWNSSSDRC